MAALISVIITNYNGKKYLKDCLESLRNNTLRDFEVVIVDNGSSDGSAAFIKNNYPRIKLLELEQNLGLAIASNKGREIAEGKYLFFYNNDTIADKNLLSELIKTTESDSRIGVCGCRTLSYDGSREINCGVPLDIFGYPYGGGNTFYVDAGIFIRQDVFDNIGGFDPKLFLYGEDKDLCWRTLLYGYKVVAVPNAIFYHDSFCAIDEQGNLMTNVAKRFMGEAFTLRILIKNYSLTALLLILPLYLFINLAEMMLFLFKRKTDVVFNSYLKAYCWNISNLLDTLRLRKIIQSRRRVSDIPILKKMHWGSGKLSLLKDVGIPRLP